MAALLGRDIFQRGDLTYYGTEIVLLLLISVDVDSTRGRGRVGTACARAVPLGHVPLSQHEQFQYTHTTREGSELTCDATSQLHDILYVSPPLKEAHPNSKPPQVENGNCGLTKMTFLRIGYLQNAACW